MGEGDDNLFEIKREMVPVGLGFVVQITSYDVSGGERRKIKQEIKQDTNLWYSGTDVDTIPMPTPEIMRPAIIME